MLQFPFKNMWFGHMKGEAVFFSKPTEIYVRIFLFKPKKNE